MMNLLSLFDVLYCPNKHCLIFLRKGSLSCSAITSFLLMVGVSSAIKMSTRQSISAHFITRDVPGLYLTSKLYDCNVINHLDNLPLVGSFKFCKNEIALWSVSMTNRVSSMYCLNFVIPKIIAAN